MECGKSLVLRRNNLLDQMKVENLTGCGVRTRPTFGIYHKRSIGPVWFKSAPLGGIILWPHPPIRCLNLIKNPTDKGCSSIPEVRCRVVLNVKVLLVECTCSCGAGPHHSVHWEANNGQSIRKTVPPCSGSIGGQWLQHDVDNTGGIEVNYLAEFRKHWWSTAVACRTGFPLKRA